MEHRKLKADAKHLIAVSKPQPVTVGLCYLALTVIISLLLSKILGVGLTQTELKQYLAHIMDGNYDYAIEYIKRILPPPSAYAVSFLLQETLSIIALGFVIFLINTARRCGACFENLLDGFGFFWKVIVFDVLAALIISLLTCLLIFPGLIIGYGYRMTKFIMVDHPEYGVLKCMKESRMMMRGHKFDLFLFDLSFLGWRILGLMPIIGILVQMWSTPFFGLSYVLYYEKLCGREYEAVLDSAE